MKKLFSRYFVAILLACIFMYPSCKKVYHSPNPTPANYRLAGYTKVTTRNIIAPPTATPVITEDYSFSYDGNNRVSGILYTSNDSNLYKTGQANLNMVFSYSGSNVYKTVTEINSANVIEQDTFALNGYGQVTSGLFSQGLWPTEYHSFSYNGSLLDGETDEYSDSGTTISGSTTFTSDNGDLLNEFFNGTLTAAFPDSGIRPVITPTDTVRDTILSYPLVVTWTQYPLNTLLPVTSSETVGSNSATLTGYTGNLVSVDAVNPNGVFVRTAYFPAGIYTQKFFQIYDFLNNRIGDYLQLQTFSVYGVNINQNVHMLKQMTTASDTTFVNYTIDADSRVTQTSVLIKDKYGNSTSMIYKLQYDTN